MKLKTTRILGAKAKSAEASPEKPAKSSAPKDEAGLIRAYGRTPEGKAAKAKLEQDKKAVRAKFAKKGRGGAIAEARKQALAKLKDRYRKEAIKFMTGKKGKGGSAESAKSASTSSPKTERGGAGLSSEAVGKMLQDATTEYTASELHPKGHSEVNIHKLSSSLAEASRGMKDKKHKSLLQRASAGLSDMNEELNDLPHMKNFLKSGTPKARIESIKESRAQTHSMIEDTLKDIKGLPRKARNAVKETIKNRLQGIFHGLQKEARNTSNPKARKAISKSLQKSLNMHLEALK